MRQTISGLVAAVALVAASAVPAMACGLFQSSCSPCGGAAYVSPCAQAYVPPAPVYTGCSLCGGASYERLPDPVQQYYYVNQGPSYTRSGRLRAVSDLSGKRRVRMGCVSHSHTITVTMAAVTPTPPIIMTMRPMPKAPRSTAIAFIATIVRGTPVPHYDAPRHYGYVRHYGYAPRILAATLPVTTVTHPRHYGYAPRYAYAPRPIYRHRYSFPHRYGYGYREHVLRRYY